MKPILFILTMLLAIPTMGQYNKVAASIGFGGHSVADESAAVTDKFNHYNADIRYSLSERFALGLSGGYDNLTLHAFNGNVVETNYSRINFEATVEVFDMLHVYSNTFTVLGHGGPGISFIRNDQHNESTFNMSGGITLLTKLSRHFAIKTDFTGTVNINHDKTLDGYIDITNAGINSTLSNVSLGLVWYPGKKGSKKGHADWFVAPEPVYTLNEVNNFNITREYIRNVAESSCDCAIVEYVFFQHDKDYIEQSELNSINQAYAYLAENLDAELWIKGYASSTKSSDEYNLDLSHRRAIKVYNKLEKMGTDMNRVSVRAFGKDQNWADEDVHDMSRRVELIITKQ